MGLLWADSCGQRSSVASMETEAQNTATAARSPRTKLEIATLALTVISAVGLIGALIFVEVSDPEEGSAIGTMFIAWMELGWLLCLVVGVVSWIWGSRKGHRGTARAGQIAVGYLVLSFVLMLFAVYGEGTR